MNETQRLKRVKAVLQGTVVQTVVAESLLEEAAGLCDPVSDKAEKIWALKLRLDRLGAEILELSKT